MRAPFVDWPLLMQTERVAIDCTGLVMCVCVCVCVWAAAGQTDDLPGTVAVRNSVTAGK